MSFTAENLSNDLPASMTTAAIALIDLEESEMCLANGLGFLKKFSEKKKTKTAKDRIKITPYSQKAKNLGSSHSLNEKTLESSSNTYKTERSSNVSYVNANMLNQKRNIQVIPKCSWDSKEQTTHKIPVISLLFSIISDYSCSLVLSKAKALYGKNDVMTSQAQDKDIELL